MYTKVALSLVLLIAIPGCYTYPDQAPPAIPPPPAVEPAAGDLGPAARDLGPDDSSIDGTPTAGSPNCTDFPEQQLRVCFAVDWGGTPYEAQPDETLSVEVTVLPDESTNGGFVSARAELATPQGVIIGLAAVPWQAPSGGQMETLDLEISLEAINDVTINAICSTSLVKTTMTYRQAKSVADGGLLLLGGFCMVASLAGPQATIVCAAGVTIIGLGSNHVWTAAEQAFDFDASVGKHCLGSPLAPAGIFVEDTIVMHNRAPELHANCQPDTLAPSAKVTCTTTATDDVDPSNLVCAARWIPGNGQVNDLCASPLILTAPDSPGSVLLIGIGTTDTGARRARYWTTGSYSSAPVEDTQPGTALPADEVLIPITIKFCTPNATRCAAGVRYLCNSAGTAESSTMCPSGQCASTTACAEQTCTPNATRCAAGVRYLCNSAGTAESSTMCPSGQCASTTACADPDECSAAGPCCDTSVQPHKLRPPSTPCATLATSWRCWNGVTDAWWSCGGSTQYRNRYRYCGTTGLCDGTTDDGPWVTTVTCNINQMCEFSGGGQCINGEYKYRDCTNCGDGACQYPAENALICPQDC